MTFLYAFVTVLAWGTWLVPSQKLKFRNLHIRTFYITSANLVLALIVWLSRGGQAITAATFWLPFIGGLIWSVSGYCAFVAIENLGLARAVGIWTPLNIIAGLVWGILLFDEFGAFGVRSRWLLLISLGVIIAGILLIILARGGESKNAAGKSLTFGLLGALGAGILWGTYFIPIRISQASMWVASWPMAIGMWTAGLLLMALAGGAPKLGNRRDYLLVALSGLVWGIGNYGMLLLTEAIGTGKGFTISQLGVAINATVGIFWLKDPRPGTRAAWVTGAGVLLAMVGGIVLGNLK